MTTTRKNHSDEPAPAVAAPPEPAPARPDRALILPGDTLDDLAERYGVPAAELLNANRQLLEDEANVRGFAGCEEGRLLFAGTWLDVPAEPEPGE